MNYMENELTVADKNLVELIENKMSTKVDVVFENYYIRLYWTQFGSDGRNLEESLKIRELINEITEIVGERLMEFYYGNDKQNVYLRY